MPRRLLTLLHREFNGLHEAAYLLGSFAFFSQLMALLRDRLLANAFGASHDLDLYYAAFRLPDLIFAAAASVVSISVLIPFLTERLDQGKDALKLFIQNVFSVFCLFISLVSLIGFIFTPWFVGHFFAGLNDIPTLVLMTRIMLLSPLLLGFSNFFASITQVYNRFFIYAISPLLYNGGIIIGILFLVPFFGLPGLAIGVALGALGHLLIQLPFIVSHGLLPKITWQINFKEIKQIVRLSLPRTVAASSNEIAEFFLISLAAALAGGSIAVFNLAFNVQSVPLSIIGVSYSLAAFPTLSRLFTAGKHQEFLERMAASTRHIIFWSMPIMTLFIVVRAQIVRVILGAGEFSWSDTRLTAAALAIFIVSIVPQNLLLLFVRSYYARGKTIKPLIINACCALGMVVLARFFLTAFIHSDFLRPVLEKMLRVEDLTGTEALILPLAFSIGVWCNVLLYWFDFSWYYRGFTRSVLPTIWQSVLSAVAMGTTSYILLGVFANWFDLNTVIGIFLQGLLAGLGGIAVYIIFLKLCGSLELAEVWTAFHHKFWKKKIVVSEPTSL